MKKRIRDRKRNKKKMEIKIEGPEEAAEELKKEEESEAAKPGTGKEAEAQKESETAQAPEEGTKEPESAETCEEAKSEEKAGGSEKTGPEKPEKPEPAEPDKPEKPDEDLNTKHLRLMADFQNFRRRTEKEKSEIYAFANEKIITDSLTILDNFERAMAAAPEGDKFAEGMDLIYKQFSEMLKKHGLTEIEALGKPFDPQFHNAVQRMAKEGAETDTVITVLQKGYILNGKVIRPSMVIVAE